MKVRIDPEVCAGFGICVGSYPEMFELHEDGYAIMRVTEVLPELEEMMRLAASQCPARAIFISDDSSD